MRGRQLSEVAFPLGGLGAGTVSLAGNGSLEDWEIFNRPAKGLSLANTFFALWAKPEGQAAAAAVLESEPVPPYTGSHGNTPGSVPGLPRFASANFSAGYPFGRVSLSDEAMPVRARLEAFSPFIPLKDIDSGLPAVVLLWTITNPGRRRVDASVAFSLLNPVGLDGTESLVAPSNPALGRNVNELVRDEHFWAIRMDSERYGPDDVRHGSMCMGVLWPKISAVTRWPRVEGWEWWETWEAWDEFSRTGRLKGPNDTKPSVLGRSDVGTLCALLNLAPGESLTVPFLLTWNFPNRVNDWNSEPEVRGKIIRNYYSTWFKDAWAVLKYLVQDFDRLTGESRKFERALYASSLPPAVLDSLAGQLVTLRSPSCFRDGEGRLFGFEGCGPKSGCCPMNCTHVWNYEQALAFLFPELERTMREVDFQVNTRADGNMAFRTLVPVESGALWQMKPAADGQCGTIMRLYRDWQFCGDMEFLRRQWPKAKQAMEFAWTGWDRDRDGMMEGEQHNTFDVEFYGANPLTTILYLGALRAAEEMAVALGDSASAREYRRIFELGSRNAVARLWNGAYFQQAGDEADKRPNQVGSGCLADQLLGQWLAHITGLGYLLPEENVRGALRAIYSENFKKVLGRHVNTARVYARSGEGGLLVCTWPKGARPRAPVPYADEVWTGSEYQVAAHLAYEGLTKEALEIVEAVRARHDGEKRNPFNEPECGNHYVRGMASWSLLLALSGFRWTAPEKTIRFVPRDSGQGFRSFFSTAGAWGQVQEGRSGKRGLVTISVESGNLAVERLLLSPSLGRLERCWIEPAKTFLRGDPERRKSEVAVTFGNAVELQAGQALVLSFSR